MKHILTFVLFLFLTLKSFAQTDGISYQAVIIGPDALELPGVDSEGNFLPSTTVDIRFTIFESGNQIEFQEVQTTTTDEFGRINLLIGSVRHDDFEKISWDGTSKDLKVDIDFRNGDGLVDMSREILTFVPYAYHRNITATGTLDVDGDTFLNRELTVNGPTNLYSTLDVNNNNASNLTGDLTVGGETNLAGSLTVEGATSLNSSLDVNNKSTTNLTGALNVGEATGLVDVDAPTVLNGTLNVVGLTTVDDFVSTGEAAFNDLKAKTLEVSDSSTLIGINVLDGDNTIGNSFDDIINVQGQLSVNSDKQIKITSTLTGVDSDINAYPVLIEGGTQGLAIKVNRSRDNSTNFITFFDTERTESWGRIEGEIPSQFTNNDDYNFDVRATAYDVYDSELDLAWALVDVGILAAKVIATGTDVRPCLGFGACAVSPGPVMIAQVIGEAVVVGLQVGFATDANNRANANEDLYAANTIKNQGVTYASGAGDYAEYLLRADVNESMSYGDIVGVKGGTISKNVIAAERMMVVSYKPIVLGNMPQSNKEKDYEKVAFMGQVPVKVFGKVNIGDYIIPSGNNDGFGKALAPEKISSKDIKNIVGVAWEASEQKHGLKLINVAVGINTNDNNSIVEKLEERVLEQDNALKQLKKLLEEAIDRLIVLENKPASQNLNETNSHNDEVDQTGISSDGRKYVIENDMIYYEITDADIERGFSFAEKMMQDGGVDAEIYSIWKKINENPSSKLKLSNSLKEKFDKQIHYHKEISKKARK
jgi:hypothetical protein